MYNTISVTLDDALAVAHAEILAGNIPLLISSPGVGKTTLASQLAQMLDADLRPLRLNSQPPEEAVGLQFIDQTSQRTVHYPPRWVPKADGSEGPVLVFLDEYTQAPDEFRKGIMSALLERYIGDATLPDNCYFLAAGNSIDDGSNVHELDTATADRFTILRIEPDVVSWCDNYAPTRNIELALAAFLRQRPDMFENSEETRRNDRAIASSPRSWEALDRFLKKARELGLTKQQIIAGTYGRVGEEVGAALHSVIDQVIDMPTITDLMKMDDKELKRHQPTTLDALWTYGQAMIWYATSEERIIDIFRLLDRLKAPELPYQETRSHIHETILTRARHVHGLKLDGNEEIGRMLNQWRLESQAPTIAKAA